MSIRSFSRTPHTAALWLSALTIIALLLSATALHAQSASPATQKRLADLKKAYDGAVTRQAGAAFSAGVKVLDERYLGALDRLITSASQGGRLDEAIALRDEKKRVTDALPLPETDAEAPEVLRPLRGTYRDQLAVIAATRDKAAAPLKDRYLQELDKLQAEYTKAGLLDDALAVRAARDDLAPPAGPAAGAADDKPVAAKGNGKTDSKAAKQMVEWALVNGVVVNTDQGAVGVNEKLKSMPTGRFSVTAVMASTMVPEFPWEALSGLSELTELQVNVAAPLTAEQTRQVAGLPALEKLTLVGQLTVDALRALPANSRLKELSINPVAGSEDVTPAIALLAIRFPAVKELGWSSRGDTTTAEACQELARWPRVTSLVTRGDLSTACVEGLARMPALEALLCLGNGTLDPVSLPKLKGLRHLNASYGRHLPGLVEAAAKLPVLAGLRISMQKRTPDDIKSLQMMPQLSDLRILMGEAAAPTDAYAPVLGSLKKLTSLVIVDGNLTDAGLKHLEGLKGLAALDIKGSQVTDPGLASFRKAVPKCKVTR